MYKSAGILEGKRDIILLGTQSKDQSMKELVHVGKGKRKINNSQD